MIGSVRTDIKDYLCAHCDPAAALALVANTMFLCLCIAKLACAATFAAQGYFRLFFYFLDHVFYFYDSVIPSGIDFHIPLSFFTSARMNCLLTSG